MEMVPALPEETDIWRSDSSLVAIIDGQVFSSHAVGGKENILELCGPGTIVLFAWHGNYRTDCFLVPQARWVKERRAVQKGR